MVQFWLVGITFLLMRKPQLDFLASLGRSFAMPSERSIMEVGLMLEVSHCASVMRGWKSRCLPLMDPPSVPVT